MEQPSEPPGRMEKAKRVIWTVVTVGILLAALIAVMMGRKSGY